MQSASFSIIKLMSLQLVCNKCNDPVVKIVFIDFKFEGSLLSIAMDESLKDCMWSKRKELLL